MPAGPDHLALYGSLMSGLRSERSPDLEGLIEIVGPCRIPGLLYDLGPFPGLVEGDGEAIGEMHRILDGRALEVMDWFEGHDPQDPAASLYRRERIRLREPDLDAWVYLFNRPTGSAPPVAGGDWRTHREVRA